MLVDRHTKRLDVPHEPGQWFELRRLSFGELRELRAASEQSYLDSLAELPTEVLDAQLRIENERAEKARAAAAEAGQEPAAEPKRDPLAGRDIATILRYGVVGWSYEEGEGEPIPVQPETIAMLDPQTATWAAREIMLLEESDVRLKGSSPSTAISPE